MNSMGVAALDLGLRGAAAGLFLMMVAVILLRARPLTPVKLLGAAMSAGGAAYAIATAPLASKRWRVCGDRTTRTESPMRSGASPSALTTS